MTAKRPNVGPKRKSYGLNEFPKGRGKIMCELCRFPLRDHEVNTHSAASR